MNDETNQQRESVVVIYRDGDDEDKPGDTRRFALSDFGGVLPDIGDQILSPWVIEGRDRNAPENRKMWTVIERHFIPLAPPDEPILALTVQERTLADAESRLIGWS